MTQPGVIWISDRPLWSNALNGRRARRALMNRQALRRRVFTRANAAGSFIYLKNQYFSGCRMLHSGYRFGGFQHILELPSRLARLLHCVMESLACQISHLLLVIRDWIRRRLAGAWNLASASYVIAEP
jgi:hypothetical protein